MSLILGNTESNETGAQGPVVDNKYIPSLALEKSNVIVSNGKSVDVSFITDSDGEVNVLSNNSSVASVSVNNNVATITGSSEGSATVSIDIAASDTYHAISESILVTVFSLESMSWVDISKIGQAGNGEQYFDIGDTKSVALKGTVSTLELDTTLYVFIIEFNYRGDNGIYFQGFKTEDGVDVCLCDSKYNSSKADGTNLFNMNHWGFGNYGGWKGCDLRYDILGSTDKAPSDYGSKTSESRVGYDATPDAKVNPVSNTLMSALPSVLRSVIQPWTVYMDNTGNISDTAANVTSSVDYLPLLAEYEIFGSRSYANHYEKDSQTQMAYYANGNNKVKNKHIDTTTSTFWWGRSAISGNASGFCGVSSNGVASYYSADYSQGLAPAFRV